MWCMEERDRVVWLHRSGGFGLPAAQLQAAVDAGAEAELQRLLDPDGAGGPPSVDPWDDTLLPLDPMDREARIHAVGAWLRQMIETGQPALDRMAWWWHGHLVSGLDKVRFARAMVEQVRLFRRDGLGSFPALLRSITLDPAMLLYLDLHTSTGRQPNENYARELLELFALGVGEYEEADVKAAATALTGWVLQRTGDVQFAPLRHDDVEGVAPAWIGLAECDPLVDEGVHYADKLRAAGVPVALEIYRGVVHGFITMARSIPEALQLREAAGAALRAAFAR